MAFDVRKKKAFVCDLDGTLFMGPNPIVPAVDFVRRNTNSGRFKFFYLTNNTSKCPEEYMKKIAGAEIPVVESQILTPLITLEAYIREKGYRSVYLIASEKVKAHMAERLSDVGVSLDYDPERNELIALTYDKELTYDKLAKATGLWNMRNCPPSPMCPIRTENQTPVDFVATHPDNCCPSERGPIPDIGACPGRVREGGGGSRRGQALYGQGDCGQRGSGFRLRPFRRDHEGRSRQVRGDSTRHCGGDV